MQDLNETLNRLADQIANGNEPGMQTLQLLIQAASPLACKLSEHSDSLRLAVAVPLLINLDGLLNENLANEDLQRYRDLVFQALA